MILTRAELERRLSAQDIAQLADLDGYGNETSGMVATCLADAEAEALGYVRIVADTLPDQVPEVLKRIVTDIARYNLYQRHIGEDHPVYLAYLRAIDTLKGIAAGHIDLGIAAGSAHSGSVTGWAPPRVFGEPTLAKAAP
ncbi:MAG: DUF1320 domain-containing protein [Rhodocyclaceae bacterium]|nr:DUF1320 domain-containing protein [Rhodocyclaceae bacterium]